MSINAEATGGPAARGAGETTPLLVSFAPAESMSEAGSGLGSGSDGGFGEEGGAMGPVLAAADALVESLVFRYVIIVATVYVIFVDPVEVLAKLPDAWDATFPFVLLIFKLVVFLLFVLEMTASAIVRGRAYLTSFFFALDLITLFSFAPDFAALFGVNLFSAHSLKLAKAGKEARISARVARLFALVRVEKIVKQGPHPIDTLNDSIVGDSDADADPQPDRATSFFALPPASPTTSVSVSTVTAPDAPGAGRRTRQRFGDSVIQSTTNKVTFLVLVLFVATTLLQVPLEWQPHAQAGLNALEGAWLDTPAYTRSTIIPMYLEPYQGHVRAIALVVNGTCILGCDFDFRSIRDEFIETVTTTASAARFNVSHTLQLQALLQIVLMLLVVVILAVGNAVICWDAYQLVELGDKLIETMKLLTDHVLGNSSFNPALASGVAPGIAEATALTALYGTAGDPVGAGARRRAASVFETLDDALSEYSYGSSDGSIVHVSQGDITSTADGADVEAGGTRRRSRLRRRKKRAGLFDILDTMQSAAVDVAAHNRHVAQRLAVLAAENLRLHMEKRQLAAFVLESGALKSEAASASVGHSAIGIHVLGADGRERPAWPREHDGRNAFAVSTIIQTEAVETPSGPAQQVVAGNIRGLLHHLLASQDVAFVDAFLASFRRYLTPTALMEHIIVRFCRVAVAAGFEPYDASEVVAWWAVDRVVAVVARWLVLAHVDFVDVPDTVDLLRTLTTILMPQLGMHADAARLTSLLDRNLSGQRLHELIVSDSDAGPSSTPLPPRPRVTVGPLSLGTADPIELARQMCLYESRLFRRIRPEELFDTAWKHPQAHALAPNVLAFIAHFDAMVRRVQVAVLDAPSHADRVATLETLVAAAVALRDLSNANGLMELVSALASNPIKRLHAAWADVSPESTAALAELKTLLFDPKAGAGVRSLAPPPTARVTFIPHFGLCLQDLFKLDDGNPDYVPAPEGAPGRLVNVRKGAFVAQLVIGTLVSWQTAPPYGFAEYPQLLAVITAPLTPDELQYEDEEALFDRSLQVEPRA